MIENNGHGFLTVICVGDEDPGDPKGGGDNRKSPCPRKIGANVTGKLCPNPRNYPSEGTSLEHLCSRWQQVGELVEIETISRAFVQLCEEHNAKK